MATGGTRPKQRNVQTPFQNSSSNQEESGGERIAKKFIEEGTRVMILMRGAPGSGKSHLARKIVNKTMGKGIDRSKFIFSTDDYFDQRGRFSFHELGQAHDWNRNRVLGAAGRRSSPIIVDNTNLEVKEMKPYAEIAVQHGYALVLLEPSTWWRYDADELEEKTEHGVSFEQICRMLDRFKDRNLSGTALLKKLHLTYPPGRMPPQPAANSQQQQQTQATQRSKSQSSDVVRQSSQNASHTNPQQCSRSMPPQQGKPKSYNIPNQTSRGNGRGRGRAGGGTSGLTHTEIRECFNEIGLKYEDVLKLFDNLTTKSSNPRTTSRGRGNFRK